MGDVGSNFANTVCIDVLPYCRNFLEVIDIVRTSVNYLPNDPRLPHHLETLGLSPVEPGLLAAAGPRS